MVRSFLSIQETADVLGVQYKTVYRLVRSGELPAAKIRRVYRIKYDDLLAYFEDQKAAFHAQVQSRGTDSVPLAHDDT